MKAMNECEAVGDSAGMVAQLAESDNAGGSGGCGPRRARISGVVDKTMQQV